MKVYPLYLLNSTICPRHAAKIINAAQKPDDIQSTTLYLHLFANLESFARRYPDAAAASWQARIDHEIEILYIHIEALCDRVSDKCEDADSGGERS